MKRPVNGSIVRFLSSGDVYLFVDSSHRITLCLGSKPIDYKPTLSKDDTDDIWSEYQVLCNIYDSDIDWKQLAELAKK